MASSKKGMLADLFDATFRTLGRTWPTTLVCGGFLFIPAAFLYGWSIGKFFDAISAVARAEGDPTVFLGLGISYAWLGLAVLAQGFVVLFVRACVTEHTARVVRGEDANVFSILWHVLSRRYGRLIGQRALLWTILGVTLTVPTVIGGVVLGVTVGASGEPGAIIGGTAALAACFVAAAVIGTWLSIRWSLTLESIVIEGARIEASLDRSAQLVRGAWWRVFGYTLLLSLMMSFAISLVATPIVFFSSLGLYGRFLQDALSGGGGEEDYLSLMRSVLAGLGSRLAILVYLQNLFAAFVVPVFMSLLFFELRKRTDAPAAAPAAPDAGGAPAASGAGDEGPAAQAGPAS